MGNSLDFGQRRSLLLFLSLLAITLIFNKLEFGNLPSYDDGYYAQKAREVLTHEDPWTLTFDNRPRFDNPPGFMWLMATSFKVFGVNEFSARFPSALAGLIGILGTFFLFELLFSTRVGLLAAVTLNLTSLYLKYSRHAMMDTTVAAAGVWCFYFFFRGLRGSQWWYVLAGAVGSYVMFAKSAFGGLPPLILLSYLLLTKQYGPFRKPGFWLGVALLPLPYLTWCVIEYRQYGDAFIQAHFYNLIIYASAQRGPNDYWYDYFVVLLKYFPFYLPFMFMGIWQIVPLIRKTKRWSAPELRPYYFTLLFFAVFFLCLSVQGTKKTWYFIPALPACCGLAALGFDQVLKKYSLAQMGKVLAGLFLLAFLVTQTTLLMQSKPRAVDTRRLAPYVRAAGQNGFTLLGYNIDNYGLNSSLLFYSDFAAKPVRDEQLQAALLAGGKVAVVLNPEEWAKVQVSHPELKVIRKSEKLVLVGNQPLPQEEVF